MRQGKTDKEVAMYLGISVNTVINHMTNAVARIRELHGTNVTRSYIINELTLAGV
jgi:DNA-binding NarL/FixJ family response regulator